MTPAFLSSPGAWDKDSHPCRHPGPGGFHWASASPSPSWAQGQPQRASLAGRNNRTVPSLLFSPATAHFPREGHSPGPMCPYYSWGLWHFGRPRLDLVYPVDTGGHSPAHIPTVSPHCPRIPRLHPFLPTTRQSDLMPRVPIALASQPPPAGLPAPPPRPHTCSSPWCSRAWYPPDPGPPPQGG